MLQCPVCRRNFLHDLGPHSVAIQGQLKERLQTYDTAEAAKKAERRAETAAVRTAQHALKKMEFSAKLPKKVTKATRKAVFLKEGKTTPTSTPTDLPSSSERQAASSSESIISNLFSIPI
jgi:hypothetical protein